MVRLLHSSQTFNRFCNASDNLSLWRHILKCANSKGECAKSGFLCRDMQFVTFLSGSSRFVWNSTEAWVAYYFFTMCGEKPNIKLMAVKKLFVLKAFMCCCVLASLLVNKVLSSLLLRHHLNTANFSKYRVGSGSSGTSIVLFCHLIGLNDILRLNQILHVVLGSPHSYGHELCITQRPLSNKIDQNEPEPPTYF